MNRRHILAAAAAAAVLPGPGLQAAPADSPVRFVQSDWGFLFVPAGAAHELGYFRDEGIASEFIVNLGGAEALAAVLGGNAEVNVGAASTALRARQRGTDATVFGASIMRYASNIVVSGEWAKKAGVTADSPEAAKLAALKGARFAVIGLGSGTHQLTLYLAKRAGLDPARDMTIVSIPNASALLAALQQGRIDGFAASSPLSDQAVHEQGASMLFRMTTGAIPELDDFLFVGLIARESWLAANPQTASKVVRAIDRALAAIHDPVTADTVRDSFHAAHHAKFDKALFDEIWAATLQAWPKTVAVTPANARKVIAFLNEFGGTDFSQDLVQTGFDYRVAAPGK